MSASHSIPWRVLFIFLPQPSQPGVIERIGNALKEVPQPLGLGIPTHLSVLVTLCAYEEREDKGFIQSQGMILTSLVVRS